MHQIYLGMVWFRASIDSPLTEMVIQHFEEDISLLGSINGRGQASTAVSQLAGIMVPEGGHHHIHCHRKQDQEWQDLGLMVSSLSSFVAYIRHSQAQKVPKHSMCRVMVIGEVVVKAKIRRFWLYGRHIFIGRVLSQKSQTDQPG
ncbi:hypothetical protein IW262DRAFT_1293644 [Armillaria fumosa]|nr:hypothetical protein IW262DRAFT_1293644 [Armillaria fumosa]